MTNEQIKIIRKLSWDYVRRCGHMGLEFDDLFSEAAVAVIEAAGKFNPARGSLSTWTWTVAENRLKTIVGQAVRNQDRETLTDAVAEDLDWADDPEQILLAKERWTDLLSRMSLDAREVCATALASGGLYLPTGVPRKARGELSRHLLSQGWSVRRVWAAFSEVKAALA